MVKNQYEYAYQRRKRSHKLLLKLLLTIIILFIIIQIGFSFFIKPYRILTNDMEPQITKGSAVFILPKAEKRPSVFNSASVKRGDIIILNAKTSSKVSKLKLLGTKFCSFITFEQHSPNNNTAMLTSNEGLYRIVGMPGDSIYMKDYILYIKPEGKLHYLTEYEVLEKKYDLKISKTPKNWNKSIGVPGNTEKKVLGENEYYLLCDNRVSGIDSRFFGSIKSNRIAGKLVCRYFPFNSISFF
ncbi:MAG: signal peptidase I [Treponema sp. CETP13]|nr:MAG: signal peptidase I [Treponema sp. CETP13]